MRFSHCIPWVLLIIAARTASCALPTTLDLKLMKEVTTNLSNNEAISPIVMSILMSQVWLATNGSTRDEITQALGLTNPVENMLLPAYKSIIDYYMAANSSQLTAEIFNQMYVKSGFTVKPSFNNLITTYYSADVATYTSPAQGVTMINSDVAEATRNRITNLVTLRHILMSELVLVSAMYFKGDWKHSFHPASAASFLTQHGEKQVNMMRLNRTRLQYADMSTYDAVALPYTDEDYCMLLIRPMERTMAAVATLRSSLDTLSIDNIIQQLSLQPVDVSIPRFEVNASYTLNDAFMKLGIKKIFGDGADFSGLTQDWEGLFVGFILHKVFIEVNEQGTEAAGAGAVIIVRGEVPNFTADRPFFAVVYNKKHKVNMFTAYVGDPPPPA